MSAALTVRLELAVWLQTRSSRICSPASLCASCLIDAAGCAQWPQTTHPPCRLSSLRPSPSPPSCAPHPAVPSAGMAMPMAAAGAQSLIHGGPGVQGGMGGVGSAGSAGGNHMLSGNGQGGVLDHQVCVVFLAAALVGCEVGAALLPLHGVAWAQRCCCGAVWHLASAHACWAAEQHSSRRACLPLALSRPFRPADPPALPSLHSCRSLLACPTACLTPTAACTVFLAPAASTEPSKTAQPGLSPRA